MSVINLVRTEQPKPSDADMDIIRRFLFGCMDGFTNDDKKRWRRWWSWMIRKEPGEMATLEVVFPRMAAVHRKQFGLMRDIYDAQERFSNFDQFIYWVKVGAGWVDWAAGPKGGVVPIPKSVSYAAADELEFEKFVQQSIEFFRGDHAAPYLWRHIENQAAHDYMESFLEQYEV